jgi:hypothetical protein
MSVLLELTHVPKEKHEATIKTLLYYGILGIERAGEITRFIYDVNYDIELLLVQIRKWPQTIRFGINPAFWPALELREG